MESYIALLLQLLVAIVFAAGALLVPPLLGKKGKRTQAKDTAYECGMDPVGTVNPRFSVKFYMVAMLFIIFDVEVVFLYPWAIIFRDLVKENWNILWPMLFFLFVLTIGFFYEWKKGALDWTR